MDEPVGDLPGLALGLFLLQRIDQFDGRKEANPLAVMLDGLNAQCRGDVGLAGSRPAHQHDIVGLVDKGAGMELAHQGFVDLAVGEIESGQILIGVCSGSVLNPTLSKTGRSFSIQRTAVQSPL